MSDDGFAQERRVELARWADTYTARIDQELTNAWPDLADRLEGAVAELSWSELAFGPGQGFRQKQVGAAVERWVERHVLPVVEAARCDLQKLLPGGQGPATGSVPTAVDGRGGLGALDVLKGLALPGGVLVGGGAVAAAVVTTTQLLVLTTVAVNWPLLIGGLLAGAALSWFGVASLAGLKEELRRRFRERLLPAVREALVGAGAEHEGEWVPSLKEQLDQQVRHIAGLAGGGPRQEGQA